MIMDYEVFKPDDERLAKIIVRFLQEKGYTAGYQLGYPNNKIFTRVDTKEEANRISEIIRRFMEEFRLTGSEITFDELQKSISIPKRVLTEAENAANLAAQLELESEEPEPEEFEPEEIEPEPEEPESEPILELEPEPEPEEPETIETISELEPEPEPEKLETISELEPEPEPEPEKLETISELEPEPEPQEPEPEPILELEQESEKPEPEPMAALEPEQESEKPEPKQKPNAKNKSQFQFFL
jgi:hypothetical protein